MSGIGRIAVQPIELGLVPELPTAAPKGQSSARFESVLNQFLNDIFFKLTFNEISYRLLNFLL